MNMNLTPEEISSLRNCHKQSSRFLSNEQVLIFASNLHQQHKLNSIDKDEQLMALVKIVKYVDKYCYQLFQCSDYEESMISKTKNWVNVQSEKINNKVTTLVHENRSLLTLEAKEEKAIIKSATELIVTSIFIGEVFE